MSVVAGQPVLGSDKAHDLVRSSNRMHRSDDGAVLCITLSSNAALLGSMMGSSATSRGSMLGSDAVLGGSMLRRNASFGWHGP